MTARRQIKASIRQRLFRRSPSCVLCGSRERLTIDHKIPLSRGGNNDIRNLQVLCFACNNAKGSELALGLVQTADWRNPWEKRT